MAGNLYVCIYKYTYINKLLQPKLIINIRYLEV